MAAGIYEAFRENQKAELQTQAVPLLLSLIQPEQYVGDVYTLGHESALVLIHDVAVDLSLADLVDQGSALFGMTRSGKSNTTKIIARSVFELRYEDETAG